MWKIALATAVAAFLLSGTAAADTWLKLVCVCPNAADSFLYFGQTINLTLNMTQKIVWDDKNGRSEFDETETSVNWTRTAAVDGGDLSWNFSLDRTTLLLSASNVWGTASYPCHKNEPQL